MDLKKYVLNIVARFLQIMSSTFRLHSTVMTLCVVKKSEFFTILKKDIYQDSSLRSVLVKCVIIL